MLSLDPSHTFGLEIHTIPPRSPAGPRDARADAFPTLGLGGGLRPRGLLGILTGRRRSAATVQAVPRIPSTNGFIWFLPQKHGFLREFRLQQVNLLRV